MEKTIVIELSVIIDNIDDGDMEKELIYELLQQLIEDESLEYTVK